MLSLDIATGARFGRWVVIGPLSRRKFGTGRNANYPVFYPCRCDCGTTRDVRAFKLLSNSRSCGCERRRAMRETATHGHNRSTGRTRLYRVWDGMTQRCGNQNHDSYPRYGGRGIAVCDGWRDFATFCAWALSHGYRDTLQIDRIDNNGPYAPENCQWATDAGNKRNTSQTRHITAFGVTKCLTDWAADHRCSVHANTIRHRLVNLRQSPEVAITAPSRR